MEKMTQENAFDQKAWPLVNANRPSKKWDQEPKY